jgi:hypothetical protein
MLVSWHSLLTIAQKYYLQPEKVYNFGFRTTLPCQEPDCEKMFDSISALYFHAAAIHYKKPLQGQIFQNFFVVLDSLA